MADLDRLVWDARAAHRANDHNEAARLFVAAHRVAPNNATIAFAACAALIRVGDADTAALAQDLLRRFPDHAAGWELLGSEFTRAGKHEAALACFRRAAEAAPSTRSTLACGRALRQLGRRAEARAAFAEACRLAPSSAVAHFLAGVSAQDEHDLPAAVASYRQAFRCDPTLAEAAVNLGTALQAAGDLPGAKEAYRNALRVRAGTFGRIAQALPAAPHGELWLDLGRLRHYLAS